MSEAGMHYKSGFREALLQAISKNTFDFLAVVRVSDLKFVFVNEKGAKLFGYENDNDLLNMFAPDLRKKVPDKRALKAIDKEINLKGYYFDEIEYITRDRTFFWGHTQHSSFTADGEEYRLLQIEKIDRARAAELSLLKEKQRFGALMDYASIGVIIIDKQLRIVLMNSCTLRMSGYTKKELAGKKIEILIPARFQEKYKLHLADYFKNPGNEARGSGMDLYAVKKDGTEFPAEITLGNFKTDKESFAILFISDISIRKKDENEIRKLNAELELKVKERTDELDITISQLEKQVIETEKAKEELVQITQFQKVVLDSSGAMIIATDSDGTINLFNQAAEILLGYKADEIIGTQNPSIYHDEVPDLIICDIMMPVLDGFGVLHLLQKNPTTKNKPFIFLTAKSEHNDFRKGMDLGADDYITKPFTGTELLTAVESRLKKIEVLTEGVNEGLKGMQKLMEVSSKDFMQDLTNDRNTNVYKKKQLIYSEHNRPTSLFYVQKGKVKTYKTNENGKALVLGLYNEGEFLGHIALLEDCNYHETAVAIEDTVLAIIPKEDFDLLINNSHEISRKFIQLLAQNISEKENQLLGMAYNSLRKKVADALLTLCKKYNTNNAEKFQIEITRENLASIAGTATESLIRTLGDFKDENLISIRESVITILNAKKLETLVN